MVAVTRRKHLCRLPCDTWYNGLGASVRHASFVLEKVEIWHT